MGWRRPLWATLALAGAAAAAAAQDLEQAARELEAAILAADASAASKAAAAVVKTQRAEAVDALLDGVQRAREREADLTRERASVERKVQDTGRRRDAAREATRKARDEWRKDEENAAAKAKLDAAEAAEKGAEREHNEIRREAYRHEQRIKNCRLIPPILLDSLAGLTDPAAVARMVDRARDSKRDWTLRAAIAAALARIETPEALAAALELLASDPEPSVRLAAIEGFGLRSEAPDEVVDAIRRALADPAWQIAAAAFQTAVRLKLVELTGDMISALERAEGRLVHDCRDALVKLTGVDKGLSPAAWKAWYERNRDAILAGTYKPAPGEAAAGAGTQITFFGLPVKSKRVVFVLDRSGSMKEKAAWVPEIGTGDGLPKDLREPKGDRKIDIARWQLKKVLHLLPEGTLFNVIFYREQFQVFSPKLVKLDRRSRPKAYEWIDAVEPDGGTNVFDSVERAMQFAMGRDGTIDPGGADTIYLLSDGLPNQGRYTAAQDVHRELTGLNRRLKMEIHTIFVGSVPPEGDGMLDKLQRQMAVQQNKAGAKFMQELAAENGGKYIGTAPPPETPE